MAIHSNVELFSAVNEIIAAFSSAGDGASAQRLRETLSISTVPGEILGELRATLRDLAQSDVVPGVRARMGDATMYLDRVL